MCIPSQTTTLCLLCLYNKQLHGHGRILKSLLRATHGSQTPTLLEGSGGKGLSAKGGGGFSFGGVAGGGPSSCYMGAKLARSEEVQLWTLVP